MSIINKICLKLDEIATKMMGECNTESDTIFDIFDMDIDFPLKDIQGEIESMLPVELTQRARKYLIPQTLLLERKVQLHKFGMFTPSWM